MCLNLQTMHAQHKKMKPTKPSPTASVVPDHNHKKDKKDSTGGKDGVIFIVEI